jgi:hypothetical protein
MGRPISYYLQAARASCAVVGGVEDLPKIRESLTPALCRRDTLAPEAGDGVGRPS